MTWAGERVVIVHAVVVVVVPHVDIEKFEPGGSEQRSI